jgi:parallel beta-helix repeat protein
MKTFIAQAFTCFLALLGIKASATTYYVNIGNASPSAPYTNWTSASTTIQAAIKFATNGDLVLVMDGSYYGPLSTNHYQLDRIMLPAGLTVQSVNGPGATTIRGFQQSTPWGNLEVRCAYLNAGSTLSGFTLTGGSTGGDVGGGSGEVGGGGVYCAASTAVVSNCIISGNLAYQFGGGIYGGTANNCTIMGNSASGTTAYAFGGGAASATLNDCVIVGNSASRGGAVSSCILNNCTLVGNSTIANSDWVNGGALASTLNNCILYYNSPYNDDGSFDSSSYNYTCTTPLPAGPGNIAVPPLLLNAGGGDYHLLSNSPCINAGDNGYVATATDFYGSPRIQGRVVDMGADEYQTPASILSYAWAQQYGIPTDGSADFEDPDGDGMNNYQESVAGTNPTNAASLLVLYSTTAATNGLNVMWQSVDNRTYYLQSSTNLGSPNAFSTVQSNITGGVGTTTCTDPSATNGNSYFYRVGVE